MWNANAWTEAEDAQIRACLKMFPFPAEMLVEQMGRTRSLNSVKARATRLRTGEVGYDKAQPSRAGAIYRRPSHGDKATLACLNCRQDFKSWDVKKNRLCPRCTGRSDDVSHVRHTARSGAF